MTPSWSSGLGFFLATVGSAVGLGNVWRFAYLAGENGGGAFIVVYLLAVAFIALPVLLAEFLVGRAGGADPTSAYANLMQRPGIAVIGWIAVIACFVTLAYYAVIAGWVARYLSVSLIGRLTPGSGETYADAFKSFTGHPIAPVLWQAGVMAATAAIVAAGVTAGIERLCRMLMPALAVMVVALAAYSMSLPGSSRALAFMFIPDWSALSRPQIYLAAVGQAFFSVGVGYGAMLTYGAYAGRGQSLPRTAVLAAIADTAFALVAGIAVFGAVFAFGLNPASGPPLAFITLPEVFARMPGGTVFAVAFFALLLAAALTSAVALLEVPVAALMQRRGMARTRAAWLLAGLIFVAGVPTALGYGPLKTLTLWGMGILEVYDTVVGEILLPLSVLLVSIFVGWLWAGGQAARDSGLAEGPAQWWVRLVRFVVPLVILLLFGATLWKL